MVSRHNAYVAYDPATRVCQACEERMEIAQDTASQEPQICSLWVSIHALSRQEESLAHNPAYAHDTDALFEKRLAQDTVPALAPP